jgi:hypothetical protein
MAMQESSATDQAIEHYSVTELSNSCEAGLVGLHLTSSESPSWSLLPGTQRGTKNQAGNC